MVMACILTVFIVAYIVVCIIIIVKMLAVASSLYPTCHLSWRLRPPLTCTHIHSLTCLLARSLAHSLAHAHTHARSLTYPLTRPPTRSLAPTYTIEASVSVGFDGVPGMPLRYIPSIQRFDTALRYSASIQRFDTALRYSPSI